MNVKEWFKTILAGIGIGVGSAIPGVSGGTIAVILKVYEKILWAISNIFKQFKRAVIYLIPVLLGVVLALIPTIYLMDKALNGFLFAIICLFAGFIVGSIPGITDEVKGEPIKKAHIIALVVAFIVAIGIGVASVLIKADVSSIMVNPKWWVYIILIPVGVLASAALVVPGLSGSMILLVIGFYKPLIGNTVEVVRQCLLENNWSNLGQQIGILACFAIGIIIGFYLISKLMHYLLAKYRVTTFYAIIGFVIGSTLALFFNYEIYSYYYSWAPSKFAWEIPVGAVLFIGGLVLSYLLVRYTRKHKQEETKKNDVVQ